MRAITSVVAALGVFGVLAAGAPARADEDDYDGGWRRHEWREHQWREHQWQEQRWHEHDRWERARQAYAAPPGYYVPPPAYYAPPPAYYAPPPAYYPPPPPVYYAPPPRPVFEAPGFSIRFGFR